MMKLGEKWREKVGLKGGTEGIKRLEGANVRGKGVPNGWSSE